MPYTLSIMNVQAFWGTQPSLTTLVPQNNVYLDVPANNLAMPYVVLTQVAQPPQWNTGGSYVSRLRFRLAIYAPVLTTVDTIVAAVLAAFDWANVTTAGFGCRLENIIPRGEIGGAYSTIIEYTLLENA